MKDERKCDLNDQHCACLEYGRDRNDCEHFHMPCPKPLSARARSSFFNDLRDQGRSRIMRENAEAHEISKDMERKIKKNTRKR